MRQNQAEFAPGYSARHPVWLIPALLMLVTGFVITTPARAGETKAKVPQFLIGGDVSLLTYEEHAGTVYQDSGRTRDALQILKARGWNCLRLRLWVHPTGQGIYVNDLPYTVALGRRIKRAGFALFLDLHYSDTWADPGHQAKPAAWKDLTFDQLVRQVQTYSHDVIAAMRQGGAMPDIVSVGNEITNGTLWPDGQVEQPDGWAHLAALLNAGIAGVRDAAAPRASPQVMIHIDNGFDAGRVQWYFGNLMSQKPAVDFDIIGLSYYPDGHGTLVDLQQSLAAAAGKYHKPIVIAETSFPFRGTSGAGQPVYSQYGLTPAGQARFLKDLVSTVRRTPDGLGRGVIYWEPEWIPVRGQGGSWSPKTLFDDDGNALPGLDALGR